MSADDAQRARVARLLTLAALAGSYSAVAELQMCRKPDLRRALAELEQELEDVAGQTGLRDDVAAIDSSQDPAGTVARMYAEARDMAARVGAGGTA